MSTLPIVCMKWGTKYGPDYANTLFAMLQRWCKQPFSLTCFTDDPTGLHPDIIPHPLPDVFIDPAEPERGWRKLGMFHPDIPLSDAPTLFLDLDVVLTGFIDVFFEIDGHFHIANDWNWRKPGVGNSSVFRFIPGSQTHVWRKFQEDPAAAKRAHRNEQEFLCANAKGLQFWPDALCRSYKRHCIPPFPLSFFKTPTLPKDARVLIFHGDPKPSDAIDGISSKWYRPLRSAPWLADFYKA